MFSQLPNFSHIYIEENALNSPIASNVLARFPKAEQIIIEDYKDVFNRPRQDWRLQKKSSKLILAVKKNEFLYKGSNVTPNFGFDNFYYNTLAMNCLYDCHYCYLQGMYSSANIVIFVNSSDYFKAVEEELKIRSPIYLCISYDTDLLALENIIPYCREWIKFAALQQNLTIELRTKSANYNAIQDLMPNTNTILAWTLSPQTVAKTYETKTPTLNARLTSVKKAIDDGWQVRLCFDPILQVDNWNVVYQEFLEEVFSTLQADSLKDISIGTFRMNTQYFDRAQKNHIESDLLHFPYDRKNGMVSYKDDDIRKISDFMLSEVNKHAPNQKVLFI